MKRYDVVVYGATGFTGRLVAEYLYRTYGEGGLRWAIAGRDPAKLNRLAIDLARDCAPKGAAADPSALPRIVADSGDDAALAELAKSATAVCSTAGPYALYGSGLVRACAEQGTHYCDLAGEMPWLLRMSDRYQTVAEASGARLVHACGFDCIPADLGVLYAQNAMRERHGTPASVVKYRLHRMDGAVSGGTIASLINMMEELGEDPGMRRRLQDPYALNPPDARRDPDGERRDLDDKHRHPAEKRRGPDSARGGRDEKDQTGAIYDEHFQRWTLPFVMAPLDARIVRRSNALMGYPYGADFRYEEAVLAPKGCSAFKAHCQAALIRAGLAAFAIAPVRRIAKRFLPAPGDGPDAEQRERGGFDIYFHAAHPTDNRKDLIARVRGDRDPGYAATAIMLAESALSLAQAPPLRPGGFWTPASALGKPLIRRLEQRAGMTFSVEDSPP